MDTPVTRSRRVAFGARSALSRLRPLLLILLLGSALSFRAAGPVAGLPHAEGFVPICTGTEIIYVPVSELAGEEPGSTEAPPSDPCPWFGLGAFFEPAAFEIVGEPAPGAIAAPLRDNARPGGHVPKGFSARAPPQGA